MIFLLDANVCIRILNRTSAAVMERFQACPPSRVRLCSIVKSELLAGARKSQQAAATMQKLRRFFGPIKSLPFDDGCAEQAGLIRSEMERLGTPIGPMDLLIAATALEFGVTLVSHNTREFGRVPGLQVEDWEQS